MRRLLGAFPFWLRFFRPARVLLECGKVDISGKHYKDSHNLGCFHLPKYNPVIIRDGDRHAQMVC